MKNNVLSLTVALVVGVILVGSLVAPTITALTDETRTYTNEGMPYASVDDDTHTIVLGTNTITVDDEAIDFSLFPSGYTGFTIVYGIADFVRYNIVSSGTNGVSILGATVSNLSVTPTDDSPVTITIVGSDITFVKDATTRTFSNVTHYIASEGDYILTETPLVKSDSIMYGEGETTFYTSSGVPVKLNLYTYWTGTTVQVDASVLDYSSAYTDCVVSSAEVNTTEVDGDLVRVDSVLINYVATYSSTDYECTSTYTYFLAPSEIVYDNPDYVGSTLAPIMLAIIVVIILALVMIAARNVTRD